MKNYEFEHRLTETENRSNFEFENKKYFDRTFSILKKHLLRLLN